MWLRVLLVSLLAGLVACGHGGDGNHPGDGGVTGDGDITGDGAGSDGSIDPDAGTNPLCTGCGAPPADVCVDGTHARHYDSVAGCENNACIYPSHVVDCPYGCANGACQADACGSTTCTAPPPACNGSTLRTSSAVCTNGTCTIAYVDEPCANGCSAGACNGPTCGAVTCDTPPAATCLDPKVLSGSTELGTCSGTCSYGQLQTLCSQGCFGGACDAGSTESIFMPPPPGPSGSTWRSNLAFAVDAAGLPHLAGQDGNGNLTYRHLDESGWHDLTVDTALGSGVQVSIALDRGVPVIAYYEPTNKRLRYAELRGAAFHIEEVSTTSPAGQYPSIAVDASGVRWIASNDGSLGLRVAHGTAGSWTFESLGTSYSGATQLAFEPAGVLHLVWGANLSQANPSGSYYQPAAYHAYRASGAWHIDQISPHGLVFKRGLSFAANGDALVAYGVVSMVGQNDELRLRRYGAVPSDVLVQSIGNWLDAGAIGVYDGRADLKFIYSSAYTIARSDGDFWSASTHDFPPNPYILDVVDGPDARPRYLASLASNSPANVSGYAFVTPPPCVPSCSGATCGGDGCGGTCGTCATGACGPDRQCSAWLEETVNVPALTTYPSQAIAIAMSPAGEHHLLVQYQFPEHYYTAGSSQDELFYLTDATGPWELPSPQTVSGIPSGNYAQTAIVTSSLQLTPAGAPEAIFAYGLAAYTWSVRHAVAGAEPWTVDWSNSAGQATPRLLDIARNAAGIEYVITECGYYGDVACVDRRDGGGHTSQTLTGVYAVAARSVVDSSGHIHILWTHMTNPSSGYHVALEYATDESGTLVSTPLAGETANGSQDVYHPQIALGPSDAIHIAFVHAGATEVHHGVWNGTDFTIDTAPAPAAGAFSLAVDHAGHAALLSTYGPATLYRLDGTWTSETLPVKGATEYPWLRFDAADKPHAFFADFTSISRQLRLSWKP
jgi:hypothetical protein